MTISMGVYQIDPSLETEMTPQNVRAIFDSKLKKADELLYDAKESGRDHLKTTPELYNAFLAEKSAQALGISENEKETLNELSDCIINGENEQADDPAGGRTCGLCTCPARILRA